MGDEPSNLQRAFWTALGYLLVGPFLAGLGLAIVMVFAPLLRLEALLPSGLPNVGVSAMVAFVWSVFPAALTAAMVIPFVLRYGTFGWIVAAVAGVIAFAVVSAFSNMPHREYLPVLAFFAGIVSLGVRQALIAGNILSEDGK